MKLLVAAGVLVLLPVSAGVPQERPSTPVLGGFVLGTPRERAARGLRCEAVRDSSSTMDSLYRAYGHAVCTKSGIAQVQLSFVRDTLIRIAANLPILNPRGGAHLSRDMAARSVCGLWDSLQTRARTIFGSALDSVGALIADSTSESVRLTAYWEPGPIRRWSGRYQVFGAYFDGGFVVCALAELSDSCVTTVPWQPCAAASVPEAPNERR